MSAVGAEGEIIRTIEHWELLSPTSGPVPESSGPGMDVFQEWVSFILQTSSDTKPRSAG